MEKASLDLVRGTLDLLILKTLTWGPMHGYAIVATIRQSTDAAVLVEDGALYPALYRMEAKGWIEAEWGLSENNRRAKYYRLTPEGRRHFCSEEKTWTAYSSAVADGIIYGVASGGGSTGSGTVFALDLGLPKPRPRALRFHPSSGSAGTPVLIWGYNLFGAAVQFNGVSATTVRTAGPNYVWATVPAGATTGPITVTTPGGSSTTHGSFTVR